ncbi:MAG: hypothetical protein IH946_04155, partial [Bacteroidetes bacterium]|nr:hypothetical protein [Bacteroidota bacterium]
MDNHTSNGADYPYTMTLIHTQKDKLHPLLSEYMMDELVPSLYSQMKRRGSEMIPYVNPYLTTPDSGIVAFLETPRFSSGYTT